jgi:hypothetical protein
MIFINGVMLTCVLRAQVKELKIKNKFYIESITFTTFKVLNAQVQKKLSTFDFLTYAPGAQVNNSLINDIVLVHVFYPIQTNSSMLI